ncbi:MAG: hypothetical protein HDR37_07815 [Treponema sp.]|nr:hypothetical protein [Treponema sp.]
MYKKIALSLTLLIVNSMCIFADRGNSVSYTISYNIASNSLDMRCAVDDFYDFLNSFYTMKKNYSRIVTEKYDWKKFNRYENLFTIYEQDMYLRIYANIEQRQPYLFYREKIMTIIFIWYLKAMDGLMIELMSTLSLEKMSIKRFASMRKSIIGKSDDKHGG